MLECNKRQKIVNRSTGLTVLRCINKRCGAFGNEVTADVCAVCPVRVAKHVRPCKETAPAPATLVQDVKDMIKDSPLADMDVEGLEVKPEGEGPTPEYPALSMQLWLYKEALMRWTRAGSPTRTQEEVEEIHETHCKPCAWYDKKKSRCKGCGCKVGVGSVAVLNKIKMKTEKCPQGFWE